MYLNFRTCMKHRLAFGMASAWRGLCVVLIWREPCASLAPSAHPPGDVKDIALHGRMAPCVLPDEISGHLNDISFRRTRAPSPVVPGAHVQHQERANRGYPNIQDCSHTHLPSESKFWTIHCTLAVWYSHSIARQPGNVHRCTIASVARARQAVKKGVEINI
jgi:hypothetical protein